MKYEEIIINNRAKLTSYVLDNGKELRIAKRPAVIVYPGGAYSYCSDREAEQVAIAFNNAGFNAFVLRYTCKKGFEEAFKDGTAGFDYLFERKEEYNINKLLVCGFSAGAHLSCAVSTMNKNRPDGMILVYPPLIQKEWELMCPSAIDLLDKIDSNTPKAFIVHAYDDPLVPVHNTYRLMEKLDNAHVEFEAHVYRNGGHGFSVANETISSGDESYENNAKATWVPMCIRWIKEAIGKIEYVKKEKVNAEDIPEICNKTLKELSSNPKTKEVISSINPAFTDEHVLEKIGEATLTSIFMNVDSFTKDDIAKIALALEEAYK